MNQQRSHRLFGIFRCFVSGSILAAGVCLIAACAGIYLSGDRPYSPEAVASAFSLISWVIYLCLALVILGLLLQLFQPKVNIRPEKQVPMHLARMRENTDLSLCGPTLRADILALRRKGSLRTGIGLGLLVFFSVIFLVCAAQPEAFSSEDINGSVVRTVVLLCALMALPFGWSVYTAYRGLKDAQTELELLRQAPKGPAPVKAPQKSYLGIARLVLLCIAIGLTAYGFAMGGAADVLTKAVNICTECIGLG